jgi:hypothetical protein
MEIIRFIIKKILGIIHSLVFIFSIVGFMMPEPFLFYFLFIWPTIYLHWQINDNNCILSDLEHYYIDGKTPPSGNKYEFPFLQKQLANAGIKLKHLDIYHFFIYGLTAFWIIGLIRYMYIRKEQKKPNNI